MVYAVSNLHMCTICQDKDKLINTQIDHPTLDRGKLLEKRKVKELECGHVFHYECIHQFFMKANNSCPNCRDAIKEEETYFEPYKDTYETKEREGCEKYISKNENGNFTYVFQNIPQPEIENILQNHKKIFDVKATIPIISFTIDQKDLSEYVRRMSEEQSNRPS